MLYRNVQLFPKHLVQIQKLAESIQNYCNVTRNAPIYQRISELKYEIDHAEIVEIKDDGKVGYGAVVVVKFIYDVDDVEETKLLITSSTGSVSNYEKYTVCTPNSPLFAFIEGKERGFSGTFKSESKKVSIEYDLEILDVYYPVDLEKK